MILQDSKENRKIGCAFWAIIGICVLIYISLPEKSFMEFYEEFSGNEWHENEARATVNLTFSLEHERVKVKNFTVQNLKRYFSLQSSYFAFDVERLAGAKGSFTINEENAKQKVWLEKIDENAEHKRFSFVVSLLPGFHANPFRCQITKTSSCGLFISVGLRDNEGGLFLVATRGYVDFKKLGFGKLGQKIVAEFFATDDKYFTIKGNLDATVYRVLGAEMEDYGELGIQSKVILGNPAERYEGVIDPKTYKKFGLKAIENICEGKKGISRKLRLLDFQRLSDSKEKVEVVNDLDRKSKMNFLKEFLPNNWLHFSNTREGQDMVESASLWYFTKSGKLITYQVDRKKEKNPNIAIAGRWKIEKNLLSITAFKNNKTLPFEQMSLSDFTLYAEENTPSPLLFRGLINEIKSPTNTLHYMHIGDVCMNKGIKLGIDFVPMDLGKWRKLQKEENYREKENIYKEQFKGVLYFRFRDTRGLYRNYYIEQDALKKFCQTHDCS